MSMSRAFVFLNCDMGAEQAIIAEMNRITGVSGATGLSGVYDIVAKLSVESDEGISKIVKRLRLISQIRSMLTMIVADKQIGP
jgi:hypothetical protein